MVELPRVEREILDDLLKEHILPPDLVHELIDLVLFEYSDLSAYGAKEALRREIKARIEKAVADEGSQGPTV